MLIELDELTDKYGFELNGVIHLGGHHGEEAHIYNKHNASQVIWVEACEKFNKVLLDNIKNYSNHQSFNILISENEGAIHDFHITNNEGSSSMLKLGTHEIRHPKVKNVNTISMKGRRLDILIEENRINIDQFNFLNIDLQGAELIALKSLGKYLTNFSYLYIEVNLNYLYRSCPLMSDIDRFLFKRGFVRRELKITTYGWGDAFYVKGNFTKADVNINIANAYFMQTKQKLLDSIKLGKVTLKKLI